MLSSKISLELTEVILYDYSITKSKKLLHIYYMRYTVLGAHYCKEYDQ